MYYLPWLEKFAMLKKQWFIIKLREIKIFKSRGSRPYLESKTRTSRLALHHWVGLTTHYNALAAILLKLIGYSRLESRIFEESIVKSLFKPSILTKKSTQLIFLCEIIAFIAGNCVLCCFNSFNFTQFDNEPLFFIHCNIFSDFTRKSLTVQLNFIKEL
jgi:hypothetical protein